MEGDWEGSRRIRMRRRGKKRIRGEGVRKEKAVSRGLEQSDRERKFVVEIGQTPENTEKGRGPKGNGKVENGRKPGSEMSLQTMPYRCICK